MEIEIKVGVTTIRGCVERARGLAADFDGPGRILVSGAEGPSATQYKLAMCLNEEGRPDRHAIDQALERYRVSPQHKAYIADVERGARGNLYYLRDRLLGMSLVGNPYRVPLEAWRHADGRVQWTLSGLLEPAKGASVVMAGLWVPDEAQSAQVGTLAEIFAAATVIPAANGTCVVQMGTDGRMTFLSTEVAIQWLSRETYKPLVDYGMEDQASAKYRTGVHLASQTLGALNSWVNGDTYRAVATTKIGRKVTAQRRADALSGEAAAIDALYGLVAELQELAA